MQGKVLVVDDEEVIRDVCSQILENEGYEVVTAASGMEALRLVSSGDEHFDVVVTDIMMPDMSGLELLEVIRRTSLDINPVVITGLGTFEMATQSDRLGAKEFVVKPFTPDELSEAVRKAVGPHPVRPV
ncbi:MAG: response regulator [Gaiellales bacterium]|nr:MAG: response regulator [Gaiellales bacterium]